MLIIAYFLVFFIGIGSCFKEAKLAWLSRNSIGLTIFEKRAYTLKACIAILIAIFGLLGLLEAIVCSGVLQ
ncbi:hypothetical protein J7S89_00325 [Acinetobacter baumannii]|uniref:Putative membrane protein n=1 Tax=Acinetobacter baumannii TaxID=470 RepID=A0A7U7KG90_ACIBA|nr:MULTISPECIES: hypothetical protein [Acinetobacter]EMT95912.1 hypothetical protein ABNIH6_09542 [Acinetobacter baumannii ABNIH6]EMU08085.1 hypothetical protein ABNIH10_09361 [Acinetobacter baumannii ABNIH10]ARG32175.1 hypothetical protein B7L41_13330 [Acinetobacter baumannii]ASO70190.1 hypothetical protein Aba7804_04935 [Acinetobacter baumannii]AVF09028.1 hypothetical protein AM457_16280 [Acinetobacter baumannii]